MSFLKSTKVITPVLVNDSILYTSTVPENDYPAWDGASSYSVGSRVIRTTTHRIYERIVAGTTPTAPEGDNLNWLDIGPTNRWAMFDDVVGTSTTATDQIIVDLFVEQIGGLALLELEARNVKIEVRSSLNVLIYTKNIDLDDTQIDSFYSWFFSPFSPKTDIVVSDLPDSYFNVKVTITITGTGTVSCGVCKFGEVFSIGATEYGATAGIIDYSRKEKDQFGRYSVVERGFAKRATLNIFTEQSDLNNIFKHLSKLRATAAVWITTEQIGYEPLIIYGFFKDFTITVRYPTVNYCSLEIEGLI